MSTQLTSRINPSTFVGRHRLYCDGEQVGLLLLLDGSVHDRWPPGFDQQQPEARVSAAHHHCHQQ